jgi:hypothetical protein
LQEQSNQYGAGYGLQALQAGMQGMQNYGNLSGLYNQQQQNIGNRCVDHVGKWFCGICFDSFNNSCDFDLDFGIRYDERKWNRNFGSYGGYGLPGSNYFDYYGFKWSGNIV